MTRTRLGPGAHRPRSSPWPALGALCLGFFMILVDTTIVVGGDARRSSRTYARTACNDVIWVTSAYLLAYAVPVLITGRLGDRLRPEERSTSAASTVFTLASLGCGLTHAAI